MNHRQKINYLIASTSKHNSVHQSLLTLRRYADKNRKNWTRTEKLMNGWLSNLRLRHCNQAVFPPYIADIVLTDYPVIIELDGSQHEFNKEYDTKRDNHFKELGYTIIRVKNYEMNNKTKVLDRIETALALFTSPIVI